VGSLRAPLKGSEMGRRLVGKKEGNLPYPTTPQRTSAQGRVAQWFMGLLTPHDAGRLIGDP